MAEDLNGKQEDRQPRFWTHKILHVAETVRAHALEVIIEPGDQRATQRHRWNRGRRFKPGYYTQPTTQQNEDTQDSQVAYVSLVSVANHFVALLADERIDLLHQVLHLSRVAHRQARPNDHEKQQDQHEHHNLHRHVIGDGRLRVLGMQMKDTQDRIRQTGEVFVQNGRYPKLLRHEGLLVERPDLKLP